MMNGVTERQKKFIEDMNEFCREKFDFKGKTKKEAYKEFAERLKEKLQWDVEFDNKLVFESDIDNLLKEMTQVEINQRKEDEGK